tara:strand:- start:318 stop:1076 length:759 start_codon:yes stop_codon:yes gene_type:complete
MRPYAWLFEQRLAQLRGTLSLRAPQSLLASQRARASTSTLHGDKRIAAIEKTLTQMGLERSRVQKLFHKRFIQACATHLFSDDVVSMREVMKRYKWPDTKQSTLILTPRRFGKTTSIAMFCGAYILSVPRCEVCIFSTGKRASTKLLELISTLVKRVPNGAERICKANQEELWVRGDTPDDTRKLSSYPSAISTLRGALCFCVRRALRGVANECDCGAVTCVRVQVWVATSLCLKRRYVGASARAVCSVAGV